MGPCVSILVREALTDEQVRRLDAWLRSVATGVWAWDQLGIPRGESLPAWELEIADGTPLGLSDVDCTNACGFTVALSDTAEYVDVRDQFLAQLGYYPQQAIAICA